LITQQSNLSCTISY